MMYFREYRGKHSLRTCGDVLEDSGSFCKLLVVISTLGALLAKHCSAALPVGQAVNVLFDSAEARELSVKVSRTN